MITKVLLQSPEFPAWAHVDCGLQMGHRARLSMWTVPARGTPKLGSWYTDQLNLLYTRLSLIFCCPISSPSRLSLHVTVSHEAYCAPRPISYTLILPIPCIIAAVAWPRWQKGRRDDVKSVWSPPSCRTVEDGVSRSGTRQRRIAVEMVVLDGGSDSGGSAERYMVSFYCRCCL